MKTIYFVSVIFLLLLCSCNSETNTSGQQVTFGIYEVAKVIEIPVEIMDNLKSTGIQIERNQQQSVIGYMTKADSIALQLNYTGQNIKLVKTFYPVDKEQKYYALVAIKPNSVIDISTIKKTKVNGKNVEIYFNLKGAKKWANLTKQNMGKSLAIVINNQIYTMPSINTEIKNGMAIINGLNDETMAKNISESLNLSCSK